MTEVSVGLSINEILQSKHFKDAQLVAGYQGRYRQVQWVHIFEASVLENYLNGHELILCTGVGWYADESTFLSVIQQAILGNAAGLCIELGAYFTKIPQTAIDLCNEHSFPLIVFTKTVRFIDITRDINILLVQSQYQMLNGLERFSNEISKLLLVPSPQKSILEVLSRNLNMTIVYRSIEEEIIVTFKKTDKERQLIKNLIENEHLLERDNVLNYPIKVLGQHYADVYAISEKDIFTELDMKLLDRGGEALGQVLFRELYAEEQRKAKEGEWINAWLEGNLNKEQIQNRLIELEPTIKLKDCVVVNCKISNLGIIMKELTYLNIYIRSVFAKQQLYVISYIKDDQLLLIILNQGKRENLKERLMEAMQSFSQYKFNGNRKIENIEFAVGKIVKELHCLKESFCTSKDARSIIDVLSSTTNISFYEDLFIFRLILSISQQGILQDFINDYLGPIIDHDRQNNGELLNTLKTFLRCKGSKKETAEQLHIVRQTLYYRLEKINELVGLDFMDFYKRQAIEFAISSYEYLQASLKSVEYARISR